MTVKVANPRKNFFFTWTTAAAAVLLVCITPVMQAQNPPLTVTCSSATQTSIQVRVCANGASTADPFMIQWVTKAEYDQYGFNPPDPACQMTFAAAPTGTDCVTIDLMDATCKRAFVCGTTYVINAFYTNSKDSSIATCSTQSCGGQGCTFTIGYWKTHGPVPTGNNANEWPVTSLTLGTVTYTADQLLSIFNTPVRGNGLISLAHQLIGAKLNIANGADGSSIAATIAAADALIGGLVIPPVGSGYLSPSVTSSLTSALDAFNSGTTGPGHCD